MTETVDIPELAKERGQSVELCAREVRYDFLRRNAEGLVATAHTASDNIETVLLNLTRGSGIKGLCGIPPKRDNLILERDYTHLTWFVRSYVLIALEHT